MESTNNLGKAMIPSYALQYSIHMTIIQNKWNFTCCHSVTEIGSNTTWACTD